jgi:hypothetical protein
MTRRGSIVYYLAALVVGSFFLAGAYQLRWLGMPLSSAERARGRLYDYFFGLVFAACTLLLSAYFLRKVTSWLGLKNVWLWVSAGAGVTLATVWTLGGLGTLLLFRMDLPSFLLLPLFYALVGPAMLLKEPFWLPLWLPILTGAPTAFVLYKIHRAFEPPMKPVSLDAGHFLQ